MFGIKKIAEGISDLKALLSESTQKTQDSLASLGQEIRVTRKREDLREASKVVLPGVGAFGDAMARLKRYDLIEPIRCEDLQSAFREFTPYLGKCRFQDSHEVLLTRSSNRA